MENDERATVPPSRSPSAPSAEILAVPLRGLVISFLLFLSTFVAPMLLWPIVAGAYADLFRNAGNALVGLGSGGSVWFVNLDAADPQHDVQLVVVDPKNRVQRRTDLSSRRHGYMPTAFLVALTLATPIGWPRRIRVLLWGLLAVHAYLALKFMLFPIAYGHDGGDAWTVAAITRSLLWVLGATTVGWALVPTLIWLSLLLFARSRAR